MAKERMFGKHLSDDEEDAILEGVGQSVGRPARKKPARQAPSRPATPPADPWKDLEGELSRRIRETTRFSVGKRLQEKARESQAIAREAVEEIREISDELDQKILESGIHKVPSVEQNVHAVLGIDVDEADLPRDAEQLLILSVRLMRAAKGFTLAGKLREAVFCYEKALVLFDRILDLDPKRENTREMKKLVSRFVAILKRRVG